MRKRVTNDSKEECMEQITGRSQKKRAKILLDEIKMKKRDTVFISSKKLFPNRKELLIEVDKSTSKKIRDEKIIKRMTIKDFE